MSAYEYSCTAAGDTLEGSDQVYITTASSSATSPNVADLGSLLTVNLGGTGGTAVWNNYGTYTTTSSSPWALGANQPARTQINHDDIIVDGRSLKDFMDSVAKRLTILQPDPKKLEKYQALREAYEHYQTLEALLTEEKNSET